MTQIKLRRDTSSNFTTANPILGSGEPAYETDTKKLKIGDGTTAYTQLEYFSAGGGGSTDITATLPLKIVDGVISLEVDGQTIQIVDGKLHANLDELGNEVLNKQDKLTPKLPLKIDAVSDERVFGFTINTQNNQMRADADQEQTMFFGFAQPGAIDTNKVHSYIKIPYSVGQLLELPYKPTQYYVDEGYANRTAMLPGWFGHTNEDGTISPVVTASMRSSWSSGSYDRKSTYLFTSFENNAGVYTKKTEIYCGEELGPNTGNASRPTVFVQINSATNSFDIQFPKGGYLNPDYTNYWTAGTTGFVASDYPTIDCFIYCPPGQESIDTNFFGLYNSETRLRNGMMRHAESNTNIFSFEGVNTSYLQLNIGSGLSVVNEKLIAKDQVRVTQASARKEYEALASLTKYTASYDGYFQAVLISDTAGFYNMYNVNNGLGFANYVPANNVFKAYVDVSIGDEVLLEYPGTLTHKELFNRQRGDV